MYAKFDHKILSMHSFPLAAPLVLAFTPKTVVTTFYFIKSNSSTMFSNRKCCAANFIIAAAGVSLMPVTVSFFAS